MTFSAKNTKIRINPSTGTVTLELVPDVRLGDVERAVAADARQEVRQRVASMMRDREGLFFLRVRKLQAQAESLGCGLPLLQAEIAELQARRERIRLQADDGWTEAVEEIDAELSAKKALACRQGKALDAIGAELSEAHFRLQDLAGLHAYTAETQRQTAAKARLAELEAKVVEALKEHLYPLLWGWAFASLTEAHTVQLPQTLICDVPWLAPESSWPVEMQQATAVETPEGQPEERTEGVLVGQTSGGFDDMGFDTQAPGMRG
jgi:hypothetical protein